ncbi:MAG: hypothetical protein JNL79_40235 [Myxococcales bacterium]|nr:hypothetical protein [Myxococcales bacterium]
MKRVLCLLLPSALACRAAPRIERDEAAAAPSSPAKTSSARRYATSTTGEPLTIEGPEISVDRTGVRIGAGPMLVPLVGDGVEGFPAEHKARGTPTDLELRALRVALSEVPKPVAPVLTLHVDPRVTYRMLVEVLFTAGVGGFSKFRFVVIEGGSEVRRSLSLELPSSGTGKPTPSASSKTLPTELDGLSLKSLGALGPGTPTAAPPGVPPAPPGFCGSAPLALTVIVASNGFYVKAFSGAIAPACSTFGAGPTVPLAGDRQDFAALRACVVKLHDCHPSSVGESFVRVTMTPSGDFQTLVSTWDAVRRRVDGTPLVPDILLTIVK